ARGVGHQADFGFKMAITFARADNTILQATVASSGNQLIEGGAYLIPVIVMHNPAVIDPGLYLIAKIAIGGAGIDPAGIPIKQRHIIAGVLDDETFGLTLDGRRVHITQGRE